MNPKKKIRAADQKEESRWEREIKNGKVKRKFRLVKVWLLAFALLISLGLGFKAWLSFRHRVWDGKSRLNIALAGEKTYLLGLDPVDSEIILIEIPSETQIEVAFGLGSYPIDSVFELSRLEKKEGILLAQTLENNLAIPVKAWIDYQKEIDFHQPRNLFLQLIYSSLKGEAKTNLTNWDRLQLLYTIKNVSVFRSNSYNLSNLNLLEEVELPDKNKGLRIEPERIDAFIQSHFQERRLREENLTIEVINTTQFPGLAERGARLLNNLGVEVVGVNNQEEKINRCQLIGEEKLKNNYSAKFIRQIFDCQWKDSQEEGRADLILILGEDYRKKF